jgi:hypothetical protein
MVHFSTSSGSYWTKQAQKLGGWALMAVTHFFGAIKRASSPIQIA